MSTPRSGMARITHDDVDGWCIRLRLAHEPHERVLIGFWNARQARAFLRWHYPTIIVTGPGEYERYLQQCDAATATEGRPA